MLRHVHAFRGLAISLVVLSHAKLLVSWSQPLSYYEAFLKVVIEGADIPFWFIAGFLLQHAADRFGYRSYLWARVRNVVLPYLVCSVPVLLHAYVFHYGVFEPTPAVSLGERAWQVTHALLTARHMFIPYWFIPTIAVLYVLAPLLLAVDRTPRLYALLPVALMLGALMHLSMLYLDVLRDAAHVLPVYVLGMAVSRYREPVLAALQRHRHLVLGAGVALSAIAIGMGPVDRIMSERAFSTENGVIDLIYLQKVILTLWAFERLSAWDAAAEQEPPGYGPIAWLADLSFGVFFVHMYVVVFVLRPGLRWLGYHPQAGVGALLGLTALFFGASIAIVLMVKRMTGKYSRYVIGC